jgi:putative ABC transport system substrate-binding protein
MMRIGWLAFGNAPGSNERDPIEPLRQALHETGYIEGRNLQIESRYAEGRHERLQGLAVELVALNLALIVAPGPAPLAAARSATRSLPIVTISGSDPVREGWAQSLARPGGNVTGLTVTFPELGSKRLELLTQARPNLARVALLYAPADLSDAAAQVTELQEGARRLGLELLAIGLGGAQDIDAAFERIRDARVQAILAFATNTVVTHRARLAASASAARLASIADFPFLAHAGFMMTYGADLVDLTRRAASYVARILGGARPGELAIERPVKFALCINLKTAATIGLTIPPSLLLRADEVIR